MCNDVIHLWSTSTIFSAPFKLKGGQISYGTVACTLIQIILHIATVKLAFPVIYGDDE
jgi:hypothetical protein